MGLKGDTSERIRLDSIWFSPDLKALNYPTIFGDLEQASNYFAS
ncbi:uncharacterized protein METZ01_LOCUS196712 [marine metagenome]|uniref:Uncharacterized protein n=1 Tax=marine metagenome TaxID=408172 RepID=A0A382DZN8_9ZZZZ